MHKILVRADDLGYSEAVNYGIAKSVNEGIVRSVGVMSNMPTVELGLKLLKKKTCLGLHTNICVGKPLVDPVLIPSIVNENGEFKSSKEYRLAKEDFVVLEEVILEIEAQYQRFIELTGEKPHYFEGHAVASANFFKGLEIVAERHECDYLGITFNEPVKFRNSLLSPVMESMLPDYNPFETLKKCVLKDCADGSIPMLVLHPGYLDKFIMETSSLLKPRVLEVEMACNEEVKRWLKENDIEVISYDELN